MSFGASAHPAVQTGGMRPVVRAICTAMGHRLAGRTEPARASAGTYTTRCKRCDVATVGDWDLMERLGAWEHYRRSF